MAVKPDVLAVAAGGATRAGPSRARNEDSHRIDQSVFLVADGMGGRAAGEVASGLAAAQVHRAWTDPATRRQVEAYAARPEADERRALFAAALEGVLAAHEAIAGESARDPAKRGMGTTLTGMLVAGGEAFFAHAGDSRAYLVRGGEAVQLSEDHSLRGRPSAAGGIWRGLLTSVLGVGDAVRVARFAIRLAAGDRVVLLTDGAHELLGEDALVGVVDAAPGPVEAAAGLVDRAAEQGASDDATAVVVEVIGGAPDPSALAPEAAAVARCPLFESLNRPERLRALRVAAARAVAPGEPLTDERTAAILVAGAAAIGGDRREPGALLQPEALIDGAAPREPAIALGPGRVLAMRRRDFLDLTEEEPDLGVKLYAALARLMAR